MTFARFMELALYDPEVGYYRRRQPRVGCGAGTDFFTASTSGPVFGKLIVAACTALLGAGDPRDYTFVEIGAEPGTGVLTDVAHPFGAARTVRVGEPFALSGRCVVFSNELFDAQPFRRGIFRRDAWRELGVAMRGNALGEIELPDAITLPVLPSNAPEGYLLDLPLEAQALAGQIATEPWTGLFVACDYGKSWRELIEACPAGTARAYHRHTQTNDLLARPGRTGPHLSRVLGLAGRRTSESRLRLPDHRVAGGLFVRHAAGFIAATAEAEAAHFSREKLSLMQLLHPAHLGQKFQVLHARRDVF